MPFLKISELQKNEEVLKVIRELKENPGITQRELSSRLGISLGKVNFLIKALIQHGLIKVHNFKNSNNKIAYLYYITPKGIKEKARITYYFLKRKMKEYEDIEREIKKLTSEIKDIAQSSEIVD
jgi:EPS-associated MarR family transcriptional regulator